MTRFGGPGEGPGEFGRAPVIALIPPDTLLTWDAVNIRLTRFHLDGTVLAAWAVDGGELADRFGNFPSEIGPRGALIGSSVELPPESSEGPERLQETLFSYDPSDRTARTVGPFPGRQQVRRGYAVVVNELDSWLHYAPDPFTGVVHVTYSGEWEIRSLAWDGTLERIAHAEWGRRPVTAEMIEARRADLEQRLAGGDELGHMEAFQLLTYPDSAPAMSAIMADREGRVWARHWSSPDEAPASRWEVFDSGGRWLGTVAIPPELGRLHEIASDRVLAEWRDELDVPYLRVYRVGRDGG